MASKRFWTEERLDLLYSLFSGLLSPGLAQERAGNLYCTYCTPLFLFYLYKVCLKFGELGLLWALAQRRLS